MKFSYSGLKLPAGVSSPQASTFCLLSIEQQIVDQAFPEETMTRTSGYSLTCLPVPALQQSLAEALEIFLTLSLGSGLE